jgi:hypothetical protein
MILFKKGDLLELLDDWSVDTKDGASMVTLDRGTLALLLEDIVVVPHPQEYVCGVRMFVGGIGFVTTSGSTEYWRDCWTLVAEAQT